MTVFCQDALGDCHAIALQIDCECVVIGERSEHQNDMLIPGIDDDRLRTIRNEICMSPGFNFDPVQAMGSMYSVG